MRKLNSPFSPASPDISRCFSGQAERAADFHKHALKAGGKWSKDPVNEVDDGVNKSESWASGQSSDRFESESEQSILAPLHREQIRK